MYQTKREKITNYVNFLIGQLKDKNKVGSKKLMVANAAIYLGVREEAVEEVLKTFQNANIVEISGDMVSV